MLYGFYTVCKVSTHTNLNRGIFLCWWFRGACPIVDLLTFFPAKGLDRSVWMEIFPSFRRICFAGFTFIKSFLRPSRPDKLHGLCSPGVVTTVTNDILLPRNQIHTCFEAGYPSGTSGTSQPDFIHNTKATKAQRPLTNSDLNHGATKFKIAIKIGPQHSRPSLLFGMRLHQLLISPSFEKTLASMQPSTENKRLDEMK